MLINLLRLLPPETAHELTIKLLRSNLHLKRNNSNLFKSLNQTILGRDNLCDLLSNGGYDVINSHTNSIHFHEINGDNSKTIDIMNSYGLAFKSGDTKTGTPVKIPGDDRKTWIRLSVGPDIDKMLFVGDIV